jgi:hypothetical protein
LWDVERPLHGIRAEYRLEEFFREGREAMTCRLGAEEYAGQVGAFEGALY